MEEACGLVGELGGAGVPTVKPWDEATLGEKLDQALAARPAAVAMDIDAAGLPFLRGQVPPAGAKSAAQIAEAMQMNASTVRSRLMRGRETLRKELTEVSNHGGRVLDGTPATAAVLPGIVDAVGDRVEVLVDGGVRSGLDVLRALALGARACLVCRPFVVAAFGGGEDGVRAFIRELRSGLQDAMEMCGAATVGDVTRELLWG